MAEPTPAEIIAAFDACLDFIWGRRYGRDYPSKDDEKFAVEWISEGLTVAVACCVFYQRMSMMHERWLRQINHNDKTNIPRNIGVFDENIRAACARIRSDGEPISTWEQSESQWVARMGTWLKGKKWLSDLWGPAPGETGCRVPPRLLASLMSTEKKTAVVKLLFF